MTAPEEPEAEEDRRRPPCRRCMMLRAFILGVLVIAVIRLSAPEALGALAGLSTMTFALVFVGTLAVLALAKSALDWVEWRRRD